ncbi:MAG: hypothetical protein JSS07_08230 [Proteobacteria bacterium]|nr:hypothetical protein [Pseudomonadota bacterium]
MKHFNQETVTAFPDETLTELALYLTKEELDNFKSNSALSNDKTEILDLLWRSLFERLRKFDNNASSWGRQETYKDLFILHFNRIKEGQLAEIKYLLNGIENKENKLPPEIHQWLSQQVSVTSVRVSDLEQRYLLLESINNFVTITTMDVTKLDVSKFDQILKNIKLPELPVGIEPIPSFIPKSLKSAVNMVDSFIFKKLYECLEHSDKPRFIKMLEGQKDRANDLLEGLERKARSSNDETAQKNFKEYSQEFKNKLESDASQKLKITMS